MADVKIVIEEKLGGQVSFGGKEIRVLKATYDAIPEDKRSEFDAILVLAQNVYQAKVDQVKSKGERPQASKLKAEAIAEIITPFLEANSVSKGSVSRGEVRVVKPTVGSKVERQKKEASSPTDKATLQAEFDDFPTDMLDDSSEVVEAKKPVGEFDDLDEELGLDDVLSDDDDVFSVPASNDPFDDDDDSTDPFDDIDLDI